jgi:hypothetical protein
VTGKNFRQNRTQAKAAAGEITGNCTALERRDENGIQNRKNESEDRDKEKRMVISSIGRRLSLGENSGTARARIRQSYKLNNKDEWLGI